MPGLGLEGVYGYKRLMSMTMAIRGPVLEDAEGRSGARAGIRGRA